MDTGLFKEFPPVNTSEWESQIISELKGAEYEKKLIWNTPEGFRIKPYFMEEDLNELDYLNTLPGNYAFVRGVKFTKNNWEIREDIEIRDITEANKLAQLAIKKGADSVGLHANEVNSTAKLAELLKNINLNTTAVHFLSADSYLDLADYFIEELNNRGIETSNIRGSFNFDPIGYYVLKGTFYHSLEENILEAKALIEKTSGVLPHFRLITVNGQHFHNAGAYLVHVLPYTLASANEYLARLTELGITIDKVAQSLQFVFAISANYFLEIAKLRALRLLWSKVVQQYKPKYESSMKMYIHASSSVWNKTVYDSYVNMLRNTTEAMSAIIGGADSLTVLPFDAPYKQADDFSRRNARNTQLLLKEESYLDMVIDPAAGSYYVETLTDTIACKALDIFKNIEKDGGFIKLFESGHIKKEIEKVCQQREMDIACRKVSILGTNQYPNAGEDMLDKIKKTDLLPQGKNSLRLYRGAESFEKMRLATETFTRKTGRKPKVFLLPMGNLAMRKARAMFAANFFSCAGFEIIDNNLFHSCEDGVKAWFGTEADIVVICSADETYPEIVPQIISGIKKVNKNVKVLVAGYPKKSIEILKHSGVDDFIHIRSNVLEVLLKYQHQLGIIWET